MELVAIGRMILSQEIDGLVLEDRINRRVYLDRDIFEIEMERIFARTWVYVGHESEVRQPGDWKATSIGLQPVIMTRGKAGNLNVLVNACRHRGTVLCRQGDRGNANSLRCPYHGWNYDIDGALIGLPWADAMRSDFRKEDWGLLQVPKVASYRGFVFASFSKEVPPLEQHLGIATSYIDAFVDLAPDGEIEAVSGVQRTGFGGNWKQACENSMDGYHPAVVHASFLKEVLKQRTGKDAMQYAVGNSPAEVKSLRNGHGLIDYTRHVIDRTSMMKLSVDAAVVEEHRARLAKRLGNEKARKVLAFGGGDNFNLLVFPNLIFINLQLRVVQPVSVDRTDIYVYPTTLKGAPPEINTARLRTHEDFYGPAGFGMPDDFEILERQWAGLQASSMEWLNLERGIERERIDGDVRVGQLLDETPLRGIWRRWRELMLAEA